jgi:exopolyphosphatase / guanosine-5'-triphosphate,3'-diphosphate pyrophosphatase
MIACDLGSNTLRIVQLDCKTQKRIQEFEQVVRTAKDIYKTKIICEESIERIKQALREAQKVFDFSKDKVYAVTTEAMRQANNSDAIIEQINDEFGITFEIIDGKEEARLTLVGIEGGLKEANKNLKSYCMMDLGGASTEISFIKEGKTVTKSFSFGIVTVAEKYRNLENIEKNINTILSHVKSFLKQNNINLKEYENFVATAGTPTSVAAFLDGLDYKSYDHEKINGKTLHVSDFRNSLEHLLKLNEEEQEFWVGTNRSELICAGIVIIERLMQILDFNECIVIDNGLREGLAIEKCNTLSKKGVIKY